MAFWLVMLKAPIMFISCPRVESCFLLQGVMVSGCFLVGKKRFLDDSREGRHLVGWLKQPRWMNSTTVVNCPFKNKKRLCLQLFCFWSYLLNLHLPYVSFKCLLLDRICYCRSMAFADHQHVGRLAISSQSSGWIKSSSSHTSQRFCGAVTCWLLF